MYISLYMCVYKVYMLLELISFCSGHLQLLTEVISRLISYYNPSKEIKASGFSQVYKFFQLHK